MRDEVLVDLQEKGQNRHGKKRFQRACIIVMIDCLAFDNSVSPQHANNFLSWIILSRKINVKEMLKVENSRRNQAVNRVLLNRSISIDGEKIFVECRVDSNNVLNLVVHLQFHRVHGRVEVNLQQNV